MTTKKLSAQERLLRLLPDTLRATLTIRLFGLTKIPLLLYVRPSVVEISDEKVVVKIPLRRRTKNHLRAMYFGALAMGADCAGGLIAMQQIMESRENISLLFKNLSAEFLDFAAGFRYLVLTEDYLCRIFEYKILHRTIPPGLYFVQLRSYCIHTHP